MASLLNFSELDFTGYAVFLLGTLVGGMILLAREREQTPLLLETRSRQQGPANDDDGHKSRWDRFKDWCGRNKVYIGGGLLATIAVLSAIVLYYEYKEISVSPLPPETMLKSGWGKGSSLSETRDALLAEDFFFAEFTEPRKVGGKDLFDKEKLFLLRIFEMFDFYKQDPPTDPRVLGALRTMQQFLRSDVERWTVGETLHIDMQPHTSYTIIGYHSCLRRDLEDASPQLKTLFNFLTQSPAPGPHRQAQEAFDVLRTDFIAKVNSILGDV